MNPAANDLAHQAYLAVRSAYALAVKLDDIAAAADDVLRGDEAPWTGKLAAVCKTIRELAESIHAPLHGCNSAVEELRAKLEASP